jgi:protein-tyrosine phosphatase
MRSKVLQALEWGDHHDFVTGRLAIGSFHASTPPECWVHFDAVLNLSTDEHADIELAGKPYHWLPFPDGDRDGFSRALPDAMEFLEEHQDQATLVHCQAGISRSVSIVLAWLCRVEGVSSGSGMVDVFDRIKARRTQAFPCQHFVDAIAESLGVEDPPQIGWRTLLDFG